MIRTLALAAALATLPVLAFAQQPEKPATPPDSSSVQKTTSEGRLDPYSANARNIGLTPDQVKQLQDALSTQGCLEGAPTGMVDSATQEGVTCAREKLHVTSYKLNDVLKALKLSFAARGNPSIEAWPAKTSHAMPMKHDTTGTHGA